MPKHLVLIGAGHSHLLVAKKAKDLLEDGIQTTLVSPGPFWYSGLATGMLGGQYDPSDDQVNPEKLIQRYGGNFIQDKMIGFEPKQRVVYLASGNMLQYDALSLNIGSEVSSFNLPTCFPVKPISNLWHLRKAIEKHLAKTDHPPKIIVIGGGPTGCEVAANLHSLVKRQNGKCKLTIISKSMRLMENNTQKISHLMETVLLNKKISILKSTSVEQVLENSVTTNGKKHDADFIVIATGLSAPEVITNAALASQKEGMIVNQYLQSITHPSLFGAGDCIFLEGYSLPKLGVFGVREAPYLAYNLRAYLLGKKMKKYTPQKKCLSIINFGDGRSLAIRGSLYWHGRLSFFLKDWLDHSFLNQYR